MKDGTIKKSRYHIWNLISVSICLLIIGFIGLRTFIGSKLPPTLKDDVAKLQSTKVSLPRDWHKPANLPPAHIITYQQNFSIQMEALRTKHSYLLLGDQSRARSYPGIIAEYKSGSLSDVERTSFSLLMADFQPIIDETSSTVRLSAYTLETDSFVTNLSFLELPYFVKLMVILARVQASEGLCQEALETALLPLYLFNRPEQSYTLTHLIAIGLANISTNSINEICSTCPSSHQLRYALETMNELRDSVFPGDSGDWWINELVALRYAAAYGYSVDISPQMRSTLLMQHGKLYSVNYYTWLRDHLPLGDPRIDAAKEGIGKTVSGEQMTILPFATFPLFNKASQINLFIFRIFAGMDPILARETMMVLDVEEADIRAKVAICMYDLTRLKLAEKLVKLDPSTTLLSYITTPPNDPFSTDAFLLSPKLNRPYSVGPDKIDDKAGTWYDSTNGALSSGDLWIRID